MHLETLAVHTAADVDRVTGSVAPPIHLSTTYEHGPAYEHIYGYTYIREANPTQTRLEKALAELEGGETALAFASGMGAGSALVALAACTPPPAPSAGQAAGGGAAKSGQAFLNYWTGWNLKNCWISWN